MLPLFKRHFPWIDQGINRIVYWFGFATIVWSLMTWVASWLPSTQNFAVAIFIGLGATCGIIVTASLALIAIRFFHPLTPKKENAAPAPYDNERDKELRWDVLYLLNYAVTQSTAVMLDTLINTSPNIMGVTLEAWFGTEEYYKQAEPYLKEVRRTLGPNTHRYAEYMSIMSATEAEMDRKIRLIPPEQRPHQDHLLLQQYAVLHRQFEKTRIFLIGQRNDAYDKIIAQRQLLMQRFSEREKSL